MSEISLEAESGKTSAEDSQKDCEEEADKAEESLSEDVIQESVDGGRGEDDGDRVMYDIDIDGGEENAENSQRDAQAVDEGVRSEPGGTCSDSEAVHVSHSVDSGDKHETNRHAETAEAPEESGESCAETQVIFTSTLGNQPTPLLCSCLVWLFGSLFALMLVASFLHNQSIIRCISVIIILNLSPS